MLDLLNSLSPHKTLKKFHRYFLCTLLFVAYVFSLQSLFDFIPEGNWTYIGHKDVRIDPTNKKEEKGWNIDLYFVYHSDPVTYYQTKLRDLLSKVKKNKTKKSVRLQSQKDKNKQKYILTKPQYENFKRWLVKMDLDKTLVYGNERLKHVENKAPMVGFNRIFSIVCSSSLPYRVNTGLELEGWVCLDQFGSPLRSFDNYSRDFLVPFASTSTISMNWVSMNLIGCILNFTFYDVILFFMNDNGATEQILLSSFTQGQAAILEGKSYGF
jgi:hypothetical protein